MKYVGVRSYDVDGKAIVPDMFTFTVLTFSINSLGPVYQVNTIVQQILDCINTTVIKKE
jgi:hypothetical protein